MIKKPIVHANSISDAMSLLQQKLVFLKTPRFKVIEALGNDGSFLVKPSDAEYFPTCWVVSPGCSGSSLLYDNMGPDACPYPVLKSHSYHTKWHGRDCIKGSVEGGFMWEIEEGDKIIYLYSHPLNIVLGYYKKVDGAPLDWERGNPQYSQYLECDVEKDFFENYLHEDILNLEKHLDKWWKLNNFDLLCVKYEKLYDCQDIIRKFLEGPTHVAKGGNREINIKLPPYKERETNWTLHPDRELLLKTYASVIEKYEQKPDYQLFLKEGRSIDDI